MDEKLPPSNVTAEEAVLGGCLLDNAMLPVAASALDPDDFHDPTLRTWYEAFLALHEDGQPIDQLTLSERMDGNYDPVLVLRLQESAGYVSARVEAHARIVAEKATRRRLLDAAGEVARLACAENEPLGDVQDRAVEAVLGARGRERRGARPLSELAVEYYDHVELLAKGGAPLGLPTGYRDLDAILGGLHESDLVILAARPSTGKSALAGCMALNAARMGHRVGWFSLEMSGEQVVMRLAAIQSGVPNQHLKEGKLTDSEWPRYVEATDALARLPVYVDDTPGISTTELRAKAMRLDAEVGLDLLIVDYLQLMHAPGETLRVRVATIGKALKSLARDMHLPVLALSQLSRAVEQRSDKRPVLSDLRESGTLEEDADVVVFLYRDEMYDENTERPNIADVIVAKHRQGPTGACSLFFKKELAQFLDAEVRRQNVEDELYQHYSDVL